MEAGLCYSCIGKLLYLDGLSPHIRSRGAVRSKLRDEGYKLPARQRNEHKVKGRTKGTHSP